jgi:hypothetical protein
VTAKAAPPADTIDGDPIDGKGNRFRKAVKAGGAFVAWNKMG